MPGISSAIGYIGGAKQTVKGTGIANPAWKLPLAARPSLRPVKTRNRYTVTDLGRDMGPAYTSQMLVQGDFQVYAEPQQLASLFYYALGANADAGTTPNYTHTETPANDLPWVTFFRMVGNQIFEQFVDCKVTSIRVEGSAGNALLVTISVVGIQAVFSAADFTGAIVAPAGLLYPEGFGALKIDTVAQPITDFAIEVNNNLSPFQADNYTLQDVDPGKREVTLSFTMRFTGAIAQPDYRAFFYGSDVGTALSPVVAQHAFDFLFTRNANSSLELLLPQVEYASVPVDADPGGAPIEVAVSGTVEKPTGGTIMSAIIKDQNATVL